MHSLQPYRLFAGDPLSILQMGFEEHASHERNGTSAEVRSAASLAGVKTCFWVAQSFLRSEDVFRSRTSFPVGRKTRFYFSGSPAAEAEIDFAGLTARLEAAPFQNMTRS